MTTRRVCVACQTAFLWSEDRPADQVRCPKCGAEQPTGTRPAPEADPHRSLTAGRVERIEDAEDRPTRSRRLWPAFLIGALSGLILAALVLWPLARRAWHDGMAGGSDLAAEDRALDPVERTAQAFLEAARFGDADRLAALGTAAPPSGIRSIRAIRRDPASDQLLRGSFAPLAALHERIERDYEYDPAIGRFEYAHPLGPAADLLDRAEAMRDDPEMTSVYDRIAGGSPHEQLDAAIQLGEQFANLTEVALPKEKLVPTYDQIAKSSEPSLPPAALALAARYGRNPERWDELLGRPLFTIRADAPFRFEEAEVATVFRTETDRRARWRLTLQRFRIEGAGIDTGWKVVAAAPEMEPETPSNGAGDISPGENIQRFQ